MNIVSVALAANFSGILSLQGLNIDGPIGLGLSAGETASDTFVLYGTLDSAAVDDTNAKDLGRFNGTAAQNLPPGIVEQARMWPYLLVQRVGGSTAGTFIACGDPAANPAVVSVAAPVAASAYSGLITLTSLGARNVRLGGSAAMTEDDTFDVYLSNDSTITSSAGCFYAGRISGGGGNGDQDNSVLFKGYRYALVQRVAGSTAGNILAAGVSPDAGGGTLNLTVLSVGDTAVSGPIGALTAAQSVDIYSAFLLTQTTASIAATLPTPTVTTAAKMAWVMNNDASAQNLVMYGMNLAPGTGQWFSWDGSAWVGGQNITQGGNAFGAALRIGTIDGQNVVIGRTGINVLVAAATSLTLGDTTGAYATTVQAGTGGVNLSPTGVGPVTIGNSIIYGTSVAVPDGTGSLGTAATTVDIASVLYVNQTTPVITYANMRTIAAPTTATAGRKIKICNVGTAVFCVGDATQKQGINLPPGTTPGGAASANKGDGCEFLWNGTAWIPISYSTPLSAVHAGTANGTGNVTRVGRFTQYDISTLAGAIVLTCILTGALIDDVIRFTRTDTTANTVTINNNAAAAQFVMVASKKNFCDVRYNGTDWELFASGQS